MSGTGETAAGQDGQDGTGDDGQDGAGVVGAVVVEVVRAMPGAPCDFPYCRLSASWSISLGINEAPVYRCVMHWPFYRDKLRRDGYQVEVRDF